MTNTSNSLRPQQGLAKSELFKIGAVLLSYTLFILIPQTQYLLTSWLPEVSPLVYNLVVYAIPMLLALGFYGKEVVANFSYFKTKTFLKIAIIIGLFILMLVGNSVVEQFLTTVTAQDGENTARLVQATENSVIASIIFFGIFGPILEEIIFRHILIGKLSKVAPSALMVFVSFLLFDLIHVHSVNDFIMYIHISAVFTFAYVFSGKNVSFTLALHLLNNLAVMLLIPFIFG